MEVVVVLSFATIFALFTQYTYTDLIVLNSLLVLDISSTTLRRLDKDIHFDNNDDLDMLLCSKKFMKCLSNSFAMGLMKGLSLLTLKGFIDILNFISFSYSLGIDFSYMYLPIFLFYSKYIFLNLYAISFFNKIIPRKFKDVVENLLSDTASKSMKK